jgi:hypothetical protein
MHVPNLYSIAVPSIDLAVSLSDRYVIRRIRLATASEIGSSMRTRLNERER